MRADITAGCAKSYGTSIIRSTSPPLAVSLTRDQKKCDLCTLAQHGGGGAFDDVNLGRGQAHFLILSESWGWRFSPLQEMDCRAWLAMKGFIPTQWSPVVLS